MRSGTKIAEAPRPRGRPRAFDRDVVLRAALQRFRTHGFAGTSLDDLAQATGVNRPSLYAAFGDKRALYIAALERTYDWLSASFANLRAAKLPPAEMLRRMYRSAIDTYLTGEVGPSGCIAINTAAAEAVTDEGIRTALKRILDLEDSEIEAALAEAGSQCPAMHARVVTCVLHSLSVRARAGDTREMLDRIAEDCIALVTGTANG